jgi:hypothetical protein
MRYEYCAEEASASAKNSTRDYLGRPAHTLVTPSELSGLLAKIYGSKIRNVLFHVDTPSQKIPEQTVAVGQITATCCCKFVRGSKRKIIDTKAK